MADDARDPIVGQIAADRDRQDLRRDVFVVEGFRPGRKRRVNVMSATLLTPRSFCILPEVISPSIRTRIVHRAPSTLP